MFFNNGIIWKTIIIYIIYVLIFAVFLFFVQKPEELILPNQEELNNNVKANNDRVALIESGLDGILVRLNLINNAKDTIDISYYTLQTGGSTEILIGSIIDAADRNVKVRILLDGIFYNLKGDLKDVLYTFSDHPNIELKLYEPLKVLKPRTWNDRLHDKLILVDDELALIGGRNIGDKYFVKDNENDDYAKDRDVIIYDYDNDPNSSIKEIKEYYNNVFEYKYAKAAVDKVSFQQSKRGILKGEKLKTIFNTYKETGPKEIDVIDWYEKTKETDGIEFIYNPIGRGNQDPWVLRKLLSLAQDAEDSVLVQSPYVIMSPEIKAKLAKFNLDAKKITMLTNSVASSPNLIAIAGYSNSKEFIVESGLALYEYQGPQSIHGKSYIFDNKISAVGSFNFDARSSYINSEIMVLINSEDFAEKLNQKVSIDLDNSLKVNKDYTYETSDKITAQSVSKTKKILVKFLSRLAHLIDYLL